MRGLSIAVVASFAFCVPAAAQTYAEPLWVRALQSGQIEEFAADRPWLDPARRDAIILGPMFKKREGGQPIDPTTVIAGQVAALDALDHRSGKFFRAIYVTAFARELAGRCNFLAPHVVGDLRRVYSALASWAVPNPATAASDADARSAVSGALAAGAGDAQRFAGTGTCGDRTMASVERSIAALLAPPIPLTETTSFELPLYSRGMFLDEGRYAHAGMRHAFGEAEAPNFGVRRIMTADEEVPGVVVGWWRNVRAALAASKNDGKRLLFVFVLEGPCQSCEILFGDLLSSERFNARAGQFRAVLASGRDDGETDVNNLFRMLGLLGWPAISVAQFAADGTLEEKKQHLGPVDRKRFFSVIEGLLGPEPKSDPVAWGKTREARGRLPAPCWRIETYPLCMSRLRGP